MVKVNIPYGKGTISAELPEKNLLGVFGSALPLAAADQFQEVIRSLDEPIGSEPLEVLAKGKNSAVIIASDHTRPVPSKFIIPEMLRRLRLGNPQIKITILIATGCHRQSSKDELIGKFGKEIVDRENIVIHNADDLEQCAELAPLPSGGRLLVNKIALECDLLVAEGFIEPHFFAGFSGGRKSVLPGVCARETVMANHCAEFISSPFARTGVLENNPIHQDMLFAAQQAQLAFIVNVVINGEKQIVRSFAGSPAAAHAAGCRFLDSACRIEVPTADIVITSNGGYPLDQNIYQSVKGLTAGEAVCRQGGVIIICTSCNDGHGGVDFYHTLKNAASPAELLRQIAAVPRHRTVPDQWQYQILARVMDKCRVIFVSRDCPHELFREMNIPSVSTVTEALEMAYDMVGKEAKIAVIPDGVSVIPKSI